MYETNEFRKGLKIEIDGEPYIMTDCQFVKPGKGCAFTRTRLKSLVSGNVIDRTYKTGERVNRANLDERVMQFMYEQDNEFHFMDTSNYEQVGIPKENMGEAPYYLIPDIEVTVMFHNGRAVSIELPNFVVMGLAECDPAIKGDTATGATKSATLPTGLVVKVPLFVSQTDKVRIDTRTGEYVERVKG